MGNKERKSEDELQAATKRFEAEQKRLAATLADTDAKVRKQEEVMKIAEEVARGPGGGANAGAHSGALGSPRAGESYSLRLARQ